MNFCSMTSIYTIVLRRPKRKYFFVIPQSPFSYLSILKISHPNCQKPSNHYIYTSAQLVTRARANHSNHRARFLPAIGSSTSTIFRCVHLPRYKRLRWRRSRHYGPSSPSVGESVRPIVAAAPAPRFETHLAVWWNDAHDCDICTYTLFSPACNFGK